jgi:ketosteroid isomerase-like protein
MDAATRALIDEQYDAFNRGDWEGLMATYSPDVVFEQHPDIRPDATTVEGHDDVRAFYAEFREMADDLHVARTSERELPDGRIRIDMVLSGRWRITALEGQLEMTHIWTVANGKLAKLEVVPRDHP